MPKPTKAPVSPPTPAPMAPPLSAAIIGPAAIKGPKARNSQCTNTGQQADRAADSTACAGANSRTLGHLCFLLVSEITGSSLVRKQHGNIIIGKTGASQLCDDGVGLSFCIY